MQKNGESLLITWEALTQAVADQVSVINVLFLQGLMQSVFQL